MSTDTIVLGRITISANRAGESCFANKMRSICKTANGKASGTRSVRIARSC